jgi:hypothetical protein
VAGATYSVNIELNQEGLQKQLTDLKTNIQGLGKLTSKNAGASREELKTITAENNLLNSNATVLGRALRLKKSSVDISNQEVRSAEAIKLIQDGEFKQAKELISASRLENTLSKNKLIMEEKTAKVAGKQVDTEMEMLRAKHRNFAVRDRLEKLAKAGVNVDQARLKYGELNTAQGAKDFDHAKKLVSELSLQLKPMERKLRLQQKINAEAAKEANRIKRLKQMSSPIRGNALTDVGSPAWNDRVSRLRGDTSPVRGTASMRGSPAWLEARSSRNRMATQSALISGAFPLLFGQGPVTAAAGALGGGLGAKFGGQMGGFAGGLAATAAVSSIQEMIAGISDLGKALDPVNGDLDALISSMGKSNTARGAELKRIEALSGKQAALEAATKDMAKVIGDDGVRALRKFSEVGVDFTNSLQRLWLKLQATLAKGVEKFTTFTGADIKSEFDAFAMDNPGDSRIIAMKNNMQRIENITQNKYSDEFKEFRTNKMGGNMGALFGEVNKEGIAEVNRLLKDQGRIMAEILTLRAQEKAESHYKDAKLELETHLKSLDDEHILEKRILELRRDGLNPATAKQIALIEKKARETDKVVQASINVLTTEIASLEAKKELQPVEEARLLLLQEQLKTLREMMALEEGTLDAISARIEEREREKEMLDLNLQITEQIRDTIKEGIVDGIYSAIEGSKTLGEVLSQVLDNLAKQILQSGVNKLFASWGGGGGGGKDKGTNLVDIYSMGQGLNIPFMAAGGSVTGGSPYVVGEKGPELFVPGSSGSIVPNSEIGGSMVINVDASGSSVEGDANKSRELGQLIGAAVQAEIGRQQRPGGMLY